MLLLIAFAGLSPTLFGEDFSRKELWSFAPPSDPTPPAVRDADWSRTDLDRFVLANLEANELRPASDASRRVLLRRLSFDLIGLPPTTSELEAFVDDDSPGAIEKVVDRLLSSPHHGERWARHWLDVVRYADSNGLDENVAHGNAWRFRDYIIEAFNEDLPYDELVQEQIAGDLLEPTNTEGSTRRRRLVATGFLSLGPKVLAEGDVAKLEMDIIDEQLDTLGKAVLGLTIGCARCHDHKYDPISTQDYYGLAGVFKSTETMESLERIARWREQTIAGPLERRAAEEHGRRIAATGKAVDALRKKVQQPGGLTPDETQALKRGEANLERLKAAAPELPSAMIVAERKGQDVAVHVRGSTRSLGPVVPRRIPAALQGDDAPSLGGQGSGRLALARWLTTPDHPLTSRVYVNRIWRWHFGRGIVETTDNFGRRGNPPSNAGLLDWLARRLVDDGWSTKRLHRRILLSRSYGMSAALDVQAAKVDPANRRLWRFSPRRLDAEELRDAVLCVSNRLDLTIGGPALAHVKNREFLFDHTSKDSTRYDSPRRAVYLPVIRNHVYDLFRLFDFPDPSVVNGDRASSTTAPQSLFLLNSGFMLDASAALAREILKGDGAGSSDPVARLYERALGRAPTKRERHRANEFLGNASFGASDPTGRPEADAGLDRGWTALVQAVLLSNEFLYLR